VAEERSRPRRDEGPASDYIPFELPQAGWVPGTIEIFKPLTSLQSADAIPISRGGWS